MREAVRRTVEQIQSSHDDEEEADKGNQQLPIAELARIDARRTLRFGR